MLWKRCSWIENFSPRRLFFSSSSLPHFFLLWRTRFHSLAPNFANTLDNCVGNEWLTRCFLLLFLSLSACYFLGKKSRREQVTLWGGLFGILGVIATIVFCRRRDNSCDLGTFCSLLCCFLCTRPSNKISVATDTTTSQITQQGNHNDDRTSQSIESSHLMCTFVLILFEKFSSSSLNICKLTFIILSTFYLLRLSAYHLSTAGTVIESPIAGVSELLMDKRKQEQTLALSNSNNNNSEQVEKYNKSQHTSEIHHFDNKTSGTRSLVSRYMDTNLNASNDALSNISITDANLSNRNNNYNHIKYPTSGNSNNTIDARNLHEVIELQRFYWIVCTTAHEEAKKK